MKVRFRTNLGSKLAAEVGITETCCDGDEREVSQDAGDRLASLGIVEVIELKIEAVPDKPAIAKAKAKTPKGMVKEFEQANESKNDE